MVDFIARIDFLVKWLVEGHQTLCASMLTHTGQKPSSEATTELLDFLFLLPAGSTRAACIMQQETASPSLQGFMTAALQLHARLVA